MNRHLPFGVAFLCLCIVALLGVAEHQKAAALEDALAVQHAYCLEADRDKQELRAAHAYQINSIKLAQRGRDEMYCAVGAAVSTALFPDAGNELEHEIKRVCDLIDASRLPDGSYDPAMQAATLQYIIDLSAKHHARLTRDGDFTPIAPHKAQLLTAPPGINFPPTTMLCFSPHVTDLKKFSDQIMDAIDSDELLFAMIGKTITEKIPDMPMAEFELHVAAIQKLLLDGSHSEDALQAAVDYVKTVRETVKPTPQRIKL